MLSALCEFPQQIENEPNNQTASLSVWSAGIIGSGFPLAELGEKYNRGEVHLVMKLSSRICGTECGGIVSIEVGQWGRSVELRSFPIETRREGQWMSRCLRQRKVKTKTVMPACPVLASSSQVRLSLRHVWDKSAVSQPMAPNKRALSSTLKPHSTRPVNPNALDATTKIVG